MVSEECFSVGEKGRAMGVGPRRDSPLYSGLFDDNASRSLT